MIRLTDGNINTPEYWDSVYSNEIQESRERIALERFQRVAAMIPQNSRVLDVGCGTSEFIRYLENYRSDCLITGVDFSSVAIKFASEKSPNSTFNIYDILKLSDIYSKEFDFVLSFETIEHVDDPQKLIDEMKKVLKSGGGLVVTTPYDNKVDGGEEHVYAFNYEDFLNFFNTDDCFIIMLCRYSENYKNLLCATKII